MALDFQATWLTLESRQLFILIGWMLVVQIIIFSLFYWWATKETWSSPLRRCLKWKLFFRWLDASKRGSTWNTQHWTLPQRSALSLSLRTSSECKAFCCMVLWPIKEPFSVLDVTHFPTFFGWFLNGSVDGLAFLKNLFWIGNLLLQSCQMKRVPSRVPKEVWFSECRDLSFWM